MKNIRAFQSPLFGSNGTKRTVPGVDTRPAFVVYDYPNGLTVRETAPRAGQSTSFVLGFKPGSNAVRGVGPRLQMDTMKSIVASLKRTAESQKIPVTFTVDISERGFPVAYVNMKQDDLTDVLAEAQKTLDAQLILDLQSIHEGDDAGLIAALRAEMEEHVVADESQSDEPATQIETEDIPF